MKRLILLTCLISASAISYADDFLYANNASFGAPYVYKVNKTTGAIVDTYTNLSSGNGRGVVVVGDTMYYTAAESGSVYSYTLSTHTNNGALFSVAGASALSTIAYDGTNFIIGDYSGTNKVYFYSTSGSLINTISLSNCTGDCDGLEYFQNKSGGHLIENRGDAGDPYDVYSLTGSLQTPGFITPPDNTETGIAYDGTDFFTSDIVTGKIDEWNSSGTFVKTLTLTGEPSGFTPLVEDLSADYATVLPPPPPSAVPEPSTFVMIKHALSHSSGQEQRSWPELFGLPNYSAPLTTPCSFTHARAATTCGKPASAPFQAASIRPYASRAPASSFIAASARATPYNGYPEFGRSASAASYAAFASANRPERMSASPRVSPTGRM